MHRSQLAYVLLLLLALPRWAVAIEPEWGHLSGRFVYDGEPPPALALEIPAHYQSRVKGKDIPDESLLVGKDGGLANVFIWLRPALGVKLPIHPSYDEPPVETLELVAQEFRLQPRAFFVRVGQKFNVHHADRRVSYNLKFDFFDTAPLLL